MTGQGPFGRGKIWSYLYDLGAQVRDIGHLEAPELLIVGRRKVNHEGVKKLLNRSEGIPLRICSQEMLLAWAMTGVDPNEDPRTGETFIGGHPTLETITEVLGGKWPGTEPIPACGETKSTSDDHESNGTPANGKADGGQFYRPEKSPVKRLGYTVGQHGESRWTRRNILWKAYRTNQDELPGSYPLEYINQWGEAGSGTRLKRIADLLARTCRSFRKQGASYDLAVCHYESDLWWLKRAIYEPRGYGFAWPDPT
jgi:hypothetical protein